MRYSAPWSSVVLCLLLSACAATPSRPARPAVQPLKLRDCSASYPHPDAVTDVTGLGITPAALGAAGQGHLALMRFHKCRVDNAEDRNKYLKQLGDQLRYDEDQLRSEIASYQADIADGQSQSDAYKATCTATDLSSQQYQACLERARQVNQFIAQVNAKYADLSARQQALNSRVTAYDADARAAPAEVSGAFADYSAALKTLGHWTDQVRALFYVPANQASVSQAACPAIAPAAKTVEELDSMASGFIACLARMPQVELAEPPVSANGLAVRAIQAGRRAPSGGIDGLDSAGGAGI